MHISVSLHITVSKKPHPESQYLQTRPLHDVHMIVPLDANQKAFISNTLSVVDDVIVHIHINLVLPYKS